MGENPSRIAHQIFNDAKYASNEDDSAREVENADMLAPWDVSRGRQSYWHQMDAIMEDDRGDEENPEEEYLNEETGDNYLLSSVQHLESTPSLDTSTAACTKKDTQSPVTNSFVSHFKRIIECFSPSTSAIIRPRTMYTEAAKSAGAMRMRRAWMMKLGRPVGLKCDQILPPYPNASTAMTVSYISSR
jgi:hypothetical protein